MSEIKKAKDLNAKDLRAKNIVELNQELESLLREQFNLRMQKGMSEKVRPQNVKSVRRSIAQIKTILNEKAREEK